MASGKIKKAIAFYQKHKLSFLVSIVASLVMALINLISYVKGGGQMYALFFLFFLGMAILRTILFILNHFFPKGESVYYFTTSIALFFFLPYISGSLMYVAYFKGPIHFPLPNLIYGYAAYAFYKMISALLNFHKSKKAKHGGKDPYLYCVSHLGMISAIYTMVSMATNLVYFSQKGKDGQVEYSIYILASVGALFSFIGAIHLLVLGFKANKKKKVLKTLTKGL